MTLTANGPEHGSNPQIARFHDVGRPLSRWMADSALQRYDLERAHWHYEDGFLFKGIEQVWGVTGDDRYRQAVARYVDHFVTPDGDIRTYRAEEYNLDQINPGKLLFSLYRWTGDGRYRRALEILRRQLHGQPRTHIGGFWHKLIYPYQMWLDGIYMASPFLAEYAASFSEPTGFDDVVHQIVTIEQCTRDSQTGLLYHAWDESRAQRWADPSTGRSPHFWGRGLGWYVMAVVDVLDHLPRVHPGREEVLAVLRRTLTSIARFQEQSSGGWYQVLDQSSRDGNYLEASACCMFVYAIAKGMRMGYLDPSWRTVAEQGYAAVLAHCVDVDVHGGCHLHWTCGGAGLGGTPYRDGSYGYYTSEKIMTDDYKGLGAFILAATEWERAAGDDVPTGEL